MADQQLMMLFGSLLAIFLLILLASNVLAPLLFAIALAYVLNDVVRLLERLRFPRLMAVLVVCLTAIITILFLMLAILPVLLEQIGQLAGKIPQYSQAIQITLHNLQESYADWLNPAYIERSMASMGTQVQSWGTAILGYSLASIPNLMALVVYSVLVPVFVFFLLKDQQMIIDWATRFLPKEHSLLDRVWNELDVQIGNYIRGRFWESVVVGVAMWLVYKLMGHDYALLLGVLTGISVWVPFVGAAVVALPVILLSFFQWGWVDTCAYAILAYGIIQMIDANIIIPWLFSEMINLHPIAIIVAVLVFGSLWGVVGVFLAIPLAALVQSVLKIIIERAHPV